MDNQEIDSRNQNFSQREKRSLIIGGVASFLLFVVITFPLTNFIMYQIVNRYEQIDFAYKAIDISPFGSIKSENLNLYARNFYLEIKDLEINVSSWGLLRGSLKSDGQLTNLSLETTFATIDLKAMIWNIDLKNILKDQPRQNIIGKAKIEASTIELLRVGPQYSKFFDESTLKTLEILNIVLNLEARNNNYSIEETKVTTNLVNLQFAGYINESFIFQNAKVCLIPAPDLANKLPQLYTLFVLQKKDQDLCFKMEGSIENPNFSRLVQNQSNGFNL